MSTDMTQNRTEQILTWICENSINGEFLNMLNVPSEGEEEWEQNEQWWMFAIGAVPPQPIESGVYLYYYTDCVDSDFYDYEIETGYENVYIHLIKVSELKE